METSTLYIIFALIMIPLLIGVVKLGEYLEKESKQKDKQNK